MAKRKTTQELIADLRLFNHHESAARMEHLDAEVRRLSKILEAYGHDGKPVFAERPDPADGG